MDGITIHKSGLIRNNLNNNNNHNSHYIGNEKSTSRNYQKINDFISETNNERPTTTTNKATSMPTSPQAPPEVRVLCFNLTYYNRLTQFLCCCAGVFTLYLLYGYLQELIFTVEGFKPFGWFLTLVQFGYYVCFGLIERELELRRKQRLEHKRCIPMRTYIVLAALTLGTMGLSNASLGYLNYPTQVIFKCCKLIPVLVGSILIQGKRYGPLDFAAALAMCIGLAWFTLADSQTSPNFNLFGVAMISGALLCDAVIGNVQEKAMREHLAPSSEVVLYSYGLGFIYLAIIMVLSGNFFSGFNFCLEHPKETYGYGFLFSLSGYLGIQFVLALVRSSGAPIAATVTTARKAVTIGISFLFFSKPFTIQYLWSGLLVVLGIYLNVFSKRNKLTLRDLEQNYKRIVAWLLMFRRHSGTRKFLIDV